MSVGRFWQGRTGSALLGWFAILSLVVISLTTLALCLVIGYQLEKNMLDWEWSATADFIRTEARQWLSPEDFARPTTPEAQARFRRFYEEAVMMPRIVRVKIYDADARVIWSDETRLIGHRFDNPQLATALTGDISVNLERTPKVENVYEPASVGLVEVYVPVMYPGQVGVAGVVETYKDLAQIFANIRQGQVTVVSTAVGGGVVLYLSLFWIVRHAARRIESQHHALQQRSRDLATTNEELTVVQGQLLQAERLAAIGEVVTAVAHGIRNPLANIRASAQVALLDCEPAPASEPTRSLKNIMAEVDRLEGCVRELLQFVRPAERRSRPMDLGDIVRAVARSFHGRLAEAGVRVEEQLAPSLLPTTGDPMLMEQVLVNLIGNAVDATPRGGRITVSTGVEPGDGAGPRVFAEVRDRGPGIAPDQIPKIFELFYTTKARGTGIGLPLAKKFTEAHGGTLTVESQLGAGARFRVSLPAEPVA